MTTNPSVCVCLDLLYDRPNKELTIVSSTLHREDGTANLGFASHGINRRITANITAVLPLYSSLEEWKRERSCMDQLLLLYLSVPGVAHLAREYAEVWEIQGHVLIDNRLLYFQPGSRPVPPETLEQVSAAFIVRISLGLSRQGDEIALLHHQVITLRRNLLCCLLVGGSLYMKRVSEFDSSIVSAALVENTGNAFKESLYHENILRDFDIQHEPLRLSESVAV